MNEPFPVIETYACMRHTALVFVRSTSYLEQLRSICCHAEDVNTAPASRRSSFCTTMSYPNLLVRKAIA